jgi:hypothetical protein
MRMRLAVLRELVVSLFEVPRGMTASLDMFEAVTGLPREEIVKVIEETGNEEKLIALDLELGLERHRWE